MRNPQTNERCLIRDNNERLLTLSQAAEIFPGRDGKTICTNTIRNWIRRGVRGVRLEGVRVGGRLYTSREALARYTDPAADRDIAKVRPSEVEAAIREFARLVGA